LGAGKNGGKNASRIYEYAESPKTQVGLNARLEGERMWGLRTGSEFRAAAPPSTSSDKSASRIPRKGGEKGVD